MKAEEMEKEALMFERPDECYIHIQRCSDEPFFMITSGDPRAIFIAIVNLIKILECKYGLPYLRTVKMLKKAVKETIEIVSEKETAA